MVAEKARHFKDHRAVGLSCHHLTPTHTNAPVEACATLTPLLGTGRSKMSCYLAIMPNLRRTQP